MLYFPFSKPIWLWSLNPLPPDSLQLEHRPSWLPSLTFQLASLPHRAPYNYHRIMQCGSARNGTQPVHAKQASPGPSCGIWISLYRNQGSEDPEVFKVIPASLPKEVPGPAGQNDICYTLSPSYSSLLAHHRQPIGLVHSCILVPGVKLSLRSETVTR